MHGIQSIFSEEFGASRALVGVGVTGSADEGGVDIGVDCANEVVEESEVVGVVFPGGGGVL